MSSAFSDQAATTIQKLGEEGQPVVIVDNVFADPEAVIDRAAAQDFYPIGHYYPGVRAPLDSDLHDALFAKVSAIASAHFGINARAWSGEALYSLVTKTPSALIPIQRLPHYDGVEENRLAALIYLCPPAFGGTSFYRHLATGFETVTAPRFNEYKNALENDVRVHGLPPAQYIEDGAPIFERIATIEPVFNRMLIYRGACLHCSAIDNNATLSDDPRRGRLTVTAFLTPDA